MQIAQAGNWGGSMAIPGFLGIHGLMGLILPAQNILVPLGSARGQHLPAQGN